MVYFFFYLLKNWHEGLKVLSLVEAMRVKFKDAKYIAKEELVEVGGCNITPNMPGC